MALLIAAWIHLGRLTDAAPLSDTQYAPPWVDEPSGRGTWGLLYSCSFTIGICVWSAIHLNIPAPHEPAERQFLRKMKWVLIGIFNPETVLFCACMQYYQASRFCKDFKALIASSESDDEQQDLNTGAVPGTARPPLTKPKNFTSSFFHLLFRSRSEKVAASRENQPEVSLRFGFYAVMGGFTVDVQDIYDHIRVLTLSPKGILYLARKSSWKHFRISGDDIEDKSKAGSAIKLLVFLQVGWAVCQCLGRAVLQYPLTILEIHTLVHAVCAMVMYGLWFHKPFDVGAATMVTVRELECYLALMLLYTLPSSPTFGSLSESIHGLEKDSVWLGRSHASVFPEWPEFSAIPVGWRRESDFLLIDLSTLEKLQLSDQDCSIGSVNHSADVQTFSPQSIQRLNNSDYFRNSIPESFSQPSEFVPSSLRDPGKVDATASDSFRNENKNRLKEAFSIVPGGGVTTAAVIKTGEVFSFGLGPVPLHCSDRKVVGQSSHQKLDYLPMDHNLLAQLFQTTNRNHSLYKLSISLSAKDMLRWRRASQALASETSWLREGLSQNNLLQRYKHFGVSTRAVETDGGARRIMLLPDELPGQSKVYGEYYATRRSANLGNEPVGWPLESGGRFQKLVGYIAFIVVIGVYAGVHLALWDFGFPTDVERLLWRISSCAMTFPLFYVFGYEILHAENFGGAWFSFYGKLKSLPRPLGELLTTIFFEGPGYFVNICIPFYTLSRIYIVVESFISIRHVPAGVYEDVSWSQYIPHL